MSENVFSVSPIELKPGYICVKVIGQNAYELFKHEAGGHRWQRIPPTETKGRRHTSTITVAVLKEPTQQEININYNKVEITTCRGSGKGGQHRNTCDSAVQLKYKDIIVRCESERSQHLNKEMAFSLLRAKLFQKVNSKVQSTQNNKRKKQIGSGMRADKIRTIRVFDNQVKNHLTNKKIRFDKYEKGFVEIIQ